MIIKLNNKEIEVTGKEPLIEIALKEGYDIPFLCYNKRAKHKPSCMICAVKNCSTGQFIPSCTTFPTDGMEIETESEEIRQVRALSLELLLSDHRADCEAPCKIACPGGLDIAMMNRLYDAGKESEALELLRDTLVIPATLCYICNAPCEKICRKNDIDKTVAIREIKKDLVSKTNLENILKPKNNGKKVAVIGFNPAGFSTAYHLCKLGYETTLFEQTDQIILSYTEDSNVPPEIINLELEVLKKMGVQFVISNENFILEDFDGIISTISENLNPEWIVLNTKSKQPARLVLEGKKLAEQVHVKLSNLKNVKTENIKPFNSSYSRFTKTEKELIGEQHKIDNRKSNCLYCDCQRKNDCKLRIYATEYGIKNIRYLKESSFNALQKQHIKEDTWFEEAKCIRCGLCVYNSDNGFTFKDRGYMMKVILSEKNNSNINEELTRLCPTGALYIKKFQVQGSRFKD